MTTKALCFTQQLQDYLFYMNPDEPDILRRLAAETDQLPRATMRLGWPQGGFMMVLLQLMQARKTIEVGVFTGYSTLCTAMALPEDGTIVACDMSREWTDIAMRYLGEAGLAHKVDLRLAPAVETLDALLAEGRAGEYDFAFIDADKVNYENYFERCLKLVRPGGLLAVDNTLWYGRVIDPEFMDDDTLAIRAFNARLRGDCRVRVSLTPVGDGLTLALKLPSGQL